MPQRVRGLAGQAGTALRAGHEGVGVVVELGAGVTEVAIGDRVAMPWLGYACGTCDYCVSGWETLCLEQKNMGYSIDGGFGEYATAYARYVVKVPEGIDPFDAAPLTCAGVTTYKALKVAGTRPSDLVAIFGVGGLGHMAIQYAALAGGRVVAVDLIDEKLELSRELGAEFTVNAAKEDPVEAIQRLGGADQAIARAVSPKSFEQAYRSLKRGGTLVFVALPAENEMKLPIFETGGRARRFSAQDGLDVDDGRAVDRLQRSHLELEPVDPADRDAMEPERVRPIGRPRREHARQRSARVVARVDLQDVSLRLVQPGHDDQLVAHADAVQRVRVGRRQDDQRVGRTLTPLPRRVRPRSQRGTDDADRHELHRYDTGKAMSQTSSVGPAAFQSAKYTSRGEPAIARPSLSIHCATASYADRICGYSTCAFVIRVYASRCAGSTRVGEPFASSTGTQTSTGPSLSSLTSPW